MYLEKKKKLIWLIIKKVEGSVLKSAIYKGGDWLGRIRKGPVDPERHYLMVELALKEILPHFSCFFLLLLLLLLPFNEYDDAIKHKKAPPTRGLQSGVQDLRVHKRPHIWELPLITGRIKI